MDNDNKPKLTIYSINTIPCTYRFFSSEALKDFRDNNPHLEKEIKSVSERDEGLPYVAVPRHPDTQYIGGKYVGQVDSGSYETRKLTAYTTPELFEEAKKIIAEKNKGVEASRDSLYESSPWL